MRDQRIRAQQPLFKTHKKQTNDRRLKRNIHAYLIALRWVPTEYILVIVMNYAFAAVRSLIRAVPGENIDIDTLHQFHTKAKKPCHCLVLVCQSATNEVFRVLHATACEIQKKLGVVNEHIVAAERFKRIEEKAIFDKRARHLQRRSKREFRLAKLAGRNFLNWWDADRRAHPRKLCKALILGRDARNA